MIRLYCQINQELPSYKVIAELKLQSRRKPHHGAFAH